MPKDNKPSKQLSEEDKKKREQARLAKEAEQREKERIQQETRRAKMAHYASLRPANIDDVPWTKARELNFIGGGSGGVLLVDLADQCVVLKQQSKTATNEMLAQHIAGVLKVPVSKVNVYKRGEDNFEKVRNIAHQCEMVGSNCSLCMNTWFGFEDRVDGACYGSAETLKPGEPRLVRQAMFDVGFFGVLEYVQGHALMGLEGNQALQTPQKNMLTQLGRLCALDVLINNLDRVPLPVWGNEGNLGNVMVVGDGSGIIGIDQQVNLISPGPGLDTYLKKVQKVVGDCAPGGDAKGVVAKIQQAMLENCGVELPADAAAIVVQGLRAGFEEISKQWDSGALKRCLEDGVAACLDRFILEDVPATMSILPAMPQLGLVECQREFVCTVAAQITKAVA